MPQGRNPVLSEFIVFPGGDSAAAQYVLFTNWLAQEATNPLDVTEGVTVNGLSIAFVSGQGTTGADTGDISFTTPDAPLGSGNGQGGITIGTGQWDGNADRGTVRLYVGGANDGSVGENIVLISADGFEVTTCGSSDPAGHAGDFRIGLGTATGGARAAQVFVDGLSTIDPSLSDALFLDNSFVRISGAPVNMGNVVAPADAVALTTDTAGDITTLVLPAGRFLIIATAYFTGDGTTTLTRAAASVSKTADTMGTDPGSFANQYLAGATMTTIGQDVAVTGIAVTDTAGNDTWHLVAQATFGVATLSAYGSIIAIPIA